MTSIPDLKPKPLKVLFLVAALNRAGTEMVLYNYIKNLSERGIFPSTVQIDLLVTSSEKGDLEPEFEQLGCKIYRVGTMKPWQSKAYRREFTKFLETHDNDEGRYDIIHSHLEERSYLPLLTASKLYAELPQEQRPKLISQSHNAHNLPWSNPRNYLKRWFVSRLRKLVAHENVGKTAVSEFSAQWLFGKSAVDNQEVTILHNPINLTGLRFNEIVRQQVRNRLEVAENTMVFGTVGRLTYLKNQQFILEICAKLKREHPNLDFKILFVGEGELRGEIQSQALKLGLSDHLILTGNVPNPYDYLQAMDLFLFPSVYEGLGLVAIEAGATGLPVLASDKVPRDVNITNNVTFLPINDAQIWVDRIQQMLDTGQLKRDINAYDKVANSPYAASNATDELLELYYKD